jgi:hypothetical protein
MPKARSFEDGISFDDVSLPFSVQSFASGVGSSVAKKCTTRGIIPTGLRHITRVATPGPGREQYSVRFPEGRGLPRATFTIGARDLISEGNYSEALRSVIEYRNNTLRIWARDHSHATSAEIDAWIESFDEVRADNSSYSPSRAQGFDQELSLLWGDISDDDITYERGEMDGSEIEHLGLVQARCELVEARADVEDLKSDLSTAHVALRHAEAKLAKACESTTAAETKVEVLEAELVKTWKSLKSTEAQVAELQKLLEDARELRQHETSLAEAKLLKLEKDCESSYTAMEDALTQELSEMGTRLYDARIEKAQTMLRHVTGAKCASKLRLGWFIWRRTHAGHLQASAKLQTACRLLRRMLLASEASAWQSWCAYVQQARQNDIALTQLLGRILRLREAMAWAAWKQFVSAHRASERVAQAQCKGAQRLIRKVRYNISRHTLRHWVDVTRAMSASTALVRAVAEERSIIAAMVSDAVNEAKLTEVQTRLKYICRSFLSSKLLNGWKKWRNHELASSQARGKILRAQKLLRSAIMATEADAWNSWSVFVEDAQSHEMAIRKLLARILRLKEAMGWAAWSRFVSHERNLEKLIEARVKATRRVATNMFLGLLARSLRQWRDLSRTITTSMALDKALSEERAISATTIAASVNEARKAYAQATLKRLLRALDAAKLRNYWSTWRANDLARIRARSKLLQTRKILGSIVSASQAQAWSSWVLFVDCVRENEKAVKKLLARILRLREAMGWAAWNRFVVYDRDCEELAKKRAVAMRRVACGMLHHSSARALKRWYDNARALSNTATVARAIAEERAIMSAMVSDSMKEMKQEEALKTLRRVVWSINTSSLRKVWGLWQQQIVARAQGRSKLLLARKTIGRSILSALATAWKSWRDFVKHANFSDVALKKLLLRILRLKEAMGWAAWNRFVAHDRTLTQQSKSRIKATKKVVANIYSRFRRRAVRQWREAIKTMGMHASITEHKQELEGTKALVAELESHVEETKKANAEIYESHLELKAKERERIIEAAKALHSEGRRKRH